MEQNNKNLFSIALIASLASSVFAITCNICDSESDFQCRYPLNESSEFLAGCYWVSAPNYLRDSDEDLVATGCMTKIVEEYGESRVIRSCYWGNISDQQKGCRNPPWSRYTTLSCYVCDTYACNSYSKSNSDEMSIEMSSSCVTESIAVVIALFFAITRWMS